MNRQSNPEAGSNTNADQCVSTELLQQALQTTLSTPAQHRFENHLAACEKCRREFESLAGEASFWKQAAESLKDSAIGTSADSGEPLPHSSVIMRLDAAIDDPEVEPVFPGVSDEAVREKLDAAKLLDPPRHPEMLGRIDGFSVEQMIGRGGMGVVYKGFDSELNRPVAIKFLAPHLAASGIARQRFSREAQAAAAVVHPNVVPIHSVNASSVRPYLVMAMVPGRSLQKHVEEHGPLPVKDVVRVAQQVADGLAAAHAQGLVHRDIKPANILLGKDVSRVMITDFGLARAADDAALTQSGWLAGTPHYMSPEQAMGDDVDQRSDLFSLGSVMYFMATGREPFRADKSWAVLQKIITQQPALLRSINSDVPLQLEQLTLRLMEKDPEQRFASATKVQEIMQEYLAHLQNPKGHAMPKFKKSGAKTSRWKTGWPLALAAVLILIGAGFSQLFSWGNNEASNQPTIGMTPIVTSLPSNSFTEKNSPTAKPAYPTPVATSNLSSGFGTASDLEAREIDQIKIELDRLERPTTSTLQPIVEEPLRAALKSLADDIQSLEMRMSDR